MLRVDYGVKSAVPSCVRFAERETRTPTRHAPRPPSVHRNIYIYIYAGPGGPKWNLFHRGNLNPIKGEQWTYHVSTSTNPTLYLYCNPFAAHSTLPVLPPGCGRVGQAVRASFAGRRGRTVLRWRVRCFSKIITTNKTAAATAIITTISGRPCLSDVVGTFALLAVSESRHA